MLCLRVVTVQQYIRRLWFVPMGITARIYATAHLYHNFTGVLQSA